MPTHKDSVKPWFETGDYPTQAQFYQMFDWLRWTDQLIGVGDLTDELINIINNANQRKITLGAGIILWAAAAGTLIEKYLIKDTGAGQAVTVRIGTTVGGNDILDDTVIDTSDSQAGILSSDFYCKAACTIYFTFTAADASTLLINIFKS